MTNMGKEGIPGPLSKLLRRNLVRQPEGITHDGPQDRHDGDGCGHQVEVAPEVVPSADSGNPGIEEGGNISFLVPDDGVDRVLDDLRADQIKDGKAKGEENRDQPPALVPPAEKKEQTPPGIFFLFVCFHLTHQRSQVVHHLFRNPVVLGINPLKRNGLHFVRDVLDGLGGIGNLIRAV